MEIAFNPAMPKKIKVKSLKRVALGAAAVVATCMFNACSPKNDTFVSSSEPQGITLNINGKETTIKDGTWIASLPKELRPMLRSIDGESRLHKNGRLEQHELDKLKQYANFEIKDNGLQVSYKADYDSDGQYEYSGSTIFSDRSGSSYTYSGVSTVPIQQQIKEYKEHALQLCARVLISPELRNNNQILQLCNEIQASDPVSILELRQLMDKVQQLCLEAKPVLHQSDMAQD